jgi:hypothetical protein
VAVFDTRRKGPAVRWGRASKGIGRTLRAHGFEMVSKPESFFVTVDNHLKRGEEVRAEEWGQRLATRLVSNDVAKVDRPGQPPTSKET